MPLFTDTSSPDLASLVGMVPRALTDAPLLSAAEEAVLASTCAAGRAAAATLAGYADPAGVERDDLEARVAAGVAARDRLILSNMRLVVSVARRFEGRGVVVTDLVQEGVLGLIAAVDGFDARRGTRFSSYAVAFIRRHVADAVRTRRAVRIPPRVERQLAACHEAAEALLHEQGRAPSARAVADRVGLAPDLLTRLVAADAPALSLDALAGDLVDDEPLEEAIDRRSSVRAVVDLLPRDEREVVELRFGLDGAGVRTVKAVGDELGRSVRWVRRVERRALARLRRHPALSALVA